MPRLIVRSFREDILNFKNMLPFRAQKIAAASNEPLPSTYGVNELVQKLHPKKQNAVIRSVEQSDCNIKIITLASADGVRLARFKAGQGINVRVGSYTQFFPMLSSPDEENYKIAVFADADDEISKTLYHASENVELEISGPEGLFYFSSIRDRKSVVFVCDVRGLAPVLSLCRYLTENEKNIFPVLFLCGRNTFPDGMGYACDNIKAFFVSDVSSVIEKTEAVIDAPSSLFVSGSAELCDSAQRIAESGALITGKPRLYIADPFQKTQSDGKQFTCCVNYRDTVVRFSCMSNETLLTAFERNNVPTQARCKVGECGYCRCKLIEGEIETLNCAEVDSLSGADKKYGFIHPCRSFPQSDVVIEL